MFAKIPKFCNDLMALNSKNNFENIQNLVYIPILKFLNIQQLRIRPGFEKKKNIKNVYSIKNIENF